MRRSFGSYYTVAYDFPRIGYKNFNILYWTLGVRPSWLVKKSIEWKPPGFGPARKVLGGYH